MWVTQSSLSGVIQQFCGWVGKARLHEHYQRVVLWYCGDFTWRYPLLSSSDVQGVLGFG